MNNVIAVHNTFSLNCILRSGLATSGSTPQNGLITSKNLTVYARRKKAEEDNKLSDTYSRLVCEIGFKLMIDTYLPLCVLFKIKMKINVCG